MQTTSPCHECQQHKNENCHIDQDLICRNDPVLTRRFQGFHIPLRLSIFAMLIYAGHITGAWWLLWVYLVGFVLNFGFVETRYLCRHCPFYEQEGFFLDCPTLKGMPKWWKYAPGAVGKGDRLLQALFGSFVDMFPFIAFVYVIVLFFLHATPVSEIITFLMIVAAMTVLFVIMGNMLMNDICKRCVNLSCPMNKTPQEVKNNYLAQNQK